jgi:hypothetical protein
MNYKTKANEEFLNDILTSCSIWTWPDMNATYIIDDGTFIALTHMEYKLLKGLTSKSFHKKIKLSIFSNYVVL